MSGWDWPWDGLRKVISGGQTGADQGGLLGAFKQGVETGGTAAALFKTSIGLNPMLAVLGLKAEGTYATRTKKNIQDSDGTVIVAYNPDSAGSKLTRVLCAELKKPVLDLNIYKIIQIASVGPAAGTDAALAEIELHAAALRRFIVEQNISVLNVAGNREMPEHSAGQYGKLIVTKSTEWIVEFALECLAADGKLIRAE